MTSGTSYSFGGIGKSIEEMSLKELRLARKHVKGYAKQHGWQTTEYIQPREDLKQINERIKKIKAEKKA